MTGLPLALTVEDSTDQSALLRLLLEREGFEVFAAADAESAIAAFAEISPALAIIDLRLPGLTGEECSQRLRERFPHCFIVISSVLDPIDYPEADAALPKPVTSAAMHELIVGLAA